MDPATQEHDALIGQTVGHYRIVEVLNTGGMGAVYRAEHEIIGKRAAVKVLRPEISREPEMVRRFFLEARSATAIRHPGIVEVYDFGHHADGRAYLVMEFLDGETLASRLESAGRLAERDAAGIVRGIASALGAAHTQGIVHRDLKPDNVFLVPDPDMPSGERPKVLDFGIAKLVDAGSAAVHHTQTGAFLGTPCYMAPEQARGSGDLDHRADLYSLGCMFYEMLVGQPPFLAEGAGEIIALQLFGEVVPPRELLPDLSPAIDALIVRMLDKDPARRPASAAEVAEALRAVTPSLSGRVSAVIPAFAPSRQQPRVTTPRPGVATPLATGATVAAPATPSMVQPVPAVVDPSPRRSWRPLWIAVPLVAAAAIGGFVLTRPGRTAARAAAVTPDAAPAATAPPAAPADIAVRLELDPPDATVSIDGAAAVRDGDALRIARDGADHQLAITAAGYQTRTVTVHADADQRLSIALAKAATATPPPVVAPPAVAPPPAKLPDRDRKHGDHHPPAKPPGKGGEHTSPAGSPIEVKL